MTAPLTKEQREHAKQGALLVLSSDEIIPRLQAQIILKYEARVVELEEALRPFAIMAQNIADIVSGEDRVPVDFVQQWGDQTDSIAVSDFRRARKALEDAP